jgi:hypothetical protein
MQPICSHPACTTCRAIVVGLIARERQSVPEVLRAGVCVEALQLVQAPRVVTAEARMVEE